jgi:hypothetical protein
MEALDLRKHPTQEEQALSALLEALIWEYDDPRHPLPRLPPNKMIAFLMEQRELR